MKGGDFVDERIRTYFIRASLMGLLIGAVFGFASGGIFAALAGAGIGFALATGSVLYWGEHGGARRRQPTGEVPPGRSDGQHLRRARRVPNQRTSTSTGWPHLNC
jgi:hypothetical protein